MRISDWSSDVCSSDLVRPIFGAEADKGPRAFLAPVDQPHIGKDLQMPRNARLALPKHLRKLAHRQLHRTEQGEDSEPGGVRKRCEDIHKHRRSEEHTSELQSLMRISYAVFCLKKTTQKP